MKRVVVIGAGVGGLTTAALLAKSGLDVTVLEAHIYPGGCAGTFFHQGYRFDAGATVAGGFYPGGPMDTIARALEIERWPARPTDPAMLVHLPDGSSIPRLGGRQRWDVRRDAFGEQAEPFWRWQERTADAMWDFALHVPPWPPQSLREGTALMRSARVWLRNKPMGGRYWQILGDAFRPVASHLRGASQRLRTFVDAQLLITAQTTSDYANALYGASALDLPRRGTVHLEGGMGTIAETLEQAVCQHGGRVLYRNEAKRVITRHGSPTAVETTRKGSFPADIVIANLPPWNIADLMGEASPTRLRNLPAQPEDGWGAFMLYLGVDESVIPMDTTLHHQVALRTPFVEGNTVFLSISPAWDAGRAPQGKRALTLSTHTALRPWWDLHAHDRSAYQNRIQAYVKRVFDASERVLPGIRDATHLELPGTPVTFQRFTHRKWGWVGGFPQTHLVRGWSPRLAPGLWMVGDSIFPGQSTAAVVLGGVRVAQAVMNTETVGNMDLEIMGNKSVVAKRLLFKCVREEV